MANSVSCREQISRPFPRLNRSNAICVGLLVVHSALLAFGAWVHSPTYNEPAHLAAGVSYWQYQRFDIYSVNPPLVKLIAAVPVLIAGCETDWSHFSERPGSRCEMAVGRDFSQANGPRILWLMTLARWTCIPLSLLGAIVCYRWATELYGPKSGVFAMCLWCFCPNVIAHGQLITSDIASASLGALACFTFWHWLKSPTWKTTIVSGITLGIAESTKTTLLIFYPLWPVLWLLYRVCDFRQLAFRDWNREGSWLILRMIISIYVLNLTYGFKETFKPIKDFQFVSELFAGPTASESDRSSNRFANHWMGQIPVPFPRHYLLGIDVQRDDFEHYHNRMYLGGRWSTTGWWYYYLYAAAIKVPIGTWSLLILATFTSSLAIWRRRRFFYVEIDKDRQRSYRDEFYLLAPALTIFVVVSSQTGINEHFRYVLPVFPFGYIWHSRVIATSKRQNLLAVILLGWSIVGSLLVYPHSLSYFNELIGGPAHGAEHLIHSNIDWGQDLRYLKRWIDDHPDARPFHLEYFGGFNPSAIGINALPMPEKSSDSPGVNGVEVPAGWYAISVDRLIRSTSTGKSQHIESRVISAFQSQPVHTHIGWSINLYHIDRPLVVPL